MGSSWYWRTGTLIALVVVATLYVVPSLVFEREKKKQKDAEGREVEIEGDVIVPSWWPTRSAVRLGLDLKGGIHLVLGVEWQKALADDAVRQARALKQWAEESGIPVADTRAVGTEIRLTFKSAEDMLTHQRRVMDDWSGRFEGARDIPVWGPGESVGTTLRLRYVAAEIEELRKGALRQALETIRRRVDPDGTGETSLSLVGDSSIQVELPGTQDTQRVRDMLGQTALLEFQLVDNSEAAKSLLEPLRGKLPAGARLDQDSEQQFVQVTDADQLPAVQKLLDGLQIPDNLEILFEKEPDPKIPNRFTYRSYTLTRLVELTGDKLADARVAMDQQNRPYVSLTMNPQGASIFARLTGDNVGRRLAIVLDDEVRSAPVLKEKIAGGRAQITMGGFKPRQQLITESRDLSVVLRSGALPAPVKIEEIRQVGAGLGADAIRGGLISVVVGTFLIMIFMVLYYRRSGVYANVAVVLNLLFLFGCLIAMGATLTLPGLAGIALTIGMAVDANVIINERIREELRLGKTARAAVEAGYDRAFWTIFDANITTAIAAVVLYQFGSGPLQGFAITLLIGLASSMYTAIVVTRLMMERHLVLTKPDTLSI